MFPGESYDRKTLLPPDIHKVAFSHHLSRGELVVENADILSLDGSTTILKDVCLRIPPGSFVTISGMSRITASSPPSYNIFRCGVQREFKLKLRPFGNNETSHIRVLWGWKVVFSRSPRWRKSCRSWASALWPG